MDFMIRDLPTSITEEIDRRAKHNRMSRQAYLQMFFVAFFTKPAETVPEPALVADLRRDFADMTQLPAISLTHVHAVSRGSLLEFVLSTRNAFALLASKNETDGRD